MTGIRWAAWAIQATQLNFCGERKREREAHDGGEEQKMVKSLRSTFHRDTVWLVKQFSVRARILTQKPDKSRTSMISAKGRLEVFFLAGSTSMGQRLDKQHITSLCKPPLDWELWLNECLSKNYNVGGKP